MNNSITDNTISLSSSYDKGENYKTICDDPYFETYHYNPSVVDKSVTFSYPSMFDYSDIE